MNTFTEKEIMIIRAAKCILKFWVDINIPENLLKSLKHEGAYVAGGAVASAITIANSFADRKDFEIMSAWCTQMPKDIDLFVRSSDSVYRLQDNIISKYCNYIKTYSDSDAVYGEDIDVGTTMITTNAITLKSQDISGMHSVIKEYDSSKSFSRDTFKFSSDTGNIGETIGLTDIMLKIEYELRQLSKRPDQYLLDYQLIKCMYGEPKEVINSFDTVHSMGFYDPKSDKLYLSRKTFDSIVDKKLIPNDNKDITKSRLDKFMKRGYNYKPMLEVELV